MADKLLKLNAPPQKDMLQRYVDMGDGTYALMVAAQITVGAGVTLEVNEADLANVGAKADAAAADDTGAFSVIALIKRSLQNWTTLFTRIPAKGPATAANSIPVVLSSDGPFSANFGLTNDAAAASDTANASFIALFKRALAYLGVQGANPAVISATLSAVTAVPATVAGLAANSFIAIAGGTVDSVTARIKSLVATATVGFYATDDDINLYPINALPVGGSVGAGSLTNTANAVGAWSLKGSGARKIYIVATAQTGNLDVSLAATPNQSRVTSILRGSLGGSVSAAPGTAPTESVAVQNSAPKAFTSTIANGGSLGGAIDFGTMRPARLVVPAGWTAAAMSFDVSADGATYGPLYDSSGTEVTIASANVVAGRQIVLDPASWVSVRYVKPRSGVNGTTQAQGAQRDIVFVGV